MQTRPPREGAPPTHGARASAQHRTGLRFRPGSHIAPRGVRRKPPSSSMPAPPPTRRQRTDVNVSATAFRPRRHRRRASRGPWRRRRRERHRTPKHTDVRSWVGARTRRTARRPQLGRATRTAPTPTPKHTDVMLWGTGARHRRTPRATSQRWGTAPARWRGGADTDSRRGAVPRTGVARSVMTRRSTGTSWGDRPHATLRRAAGSSRCTSAGRRSAA